MVPVMTPEHFGKLTGLGDWRRAGEKRKTGWLGDDREGSTPNRETGSTQANRFDGNDAQDGGEPG